jgi:hypothetical protein
MEVDCIATWVIWVQAFVDCVWRKKELKVGDVYQAKHTHYATQENMKMLQVKFFFLSSISFSSLLSRRTLKKWVFLSLVVQCSKA